MQRPKIRCRLIRGWKYEVGRGAKRRIERDDDAWVAHWQIVGTDKRGELPILDIGGELVRSMTMDEAMREAAAKFLKELPSAEIEWQLDLRDARREQAQPDKN